MNRHISTVLSALFILISVGCGGEPAGRVSGKLTYKNEPVVGGSITFVPQTAGKPYAYAETKEDGTYVAETDTTGQKIPVGDYRIMVSAVKDLGPEAPVELLIPLRYGSDTGSGLTAKVEVGENTVNLDLVP